MPRITNTDSQDSFPKSLRETQRFSTLWEVSQQEFIDFLSFLNLLHDGFGTKKFLQTTPHLSHTP